MINIVVLTHTNPLCPENTIIVIYLLFITKFVVKKTTSIYKTEPNFNNIHYLKCSSFYTTSPGVHWDLDN